ncbi:hypothetical protein [uncultured Sphingomonas sp.]|uniref:hypothetical protein n=1 Tax=uncultured Sphingomonas sp. TaxID=158754 RepID=UPI0025EB96A3|nr:hypothetical protein [uncultured Sphingomonas sp.]
MIRLAATTSPVEVAWHAYDTEMLALHQMYVAGAQTQHGDRLEQALKVGRLWDEFLHQVALEDGGDDPRPAA